MLIIEDWRSTYPDAINYYWNLTEFSEDDGKNVLFLGWATVEKGDSYKKKYENYENKMFFNTEHPCAFQSPSAKDRMLSANMDKYFNKVFTMCPYTAEWLNTMQKANHFREIYPTTPYNRRDIIFKKEEKIYDALFWGGIHSRFHEDILDVIKEYNYNFLTISPDHWRYQKPEYINLITHNNIPRREMWKLARQTKVHIMINLLFPDQNGINNIQNIEGWEKNKAFHCLDEKIAPQIKGRPNESAFNRCLMLVRKDPWNLQEKSFVPEKEFLYYENEGDLKDMIDDITINWHNYEDIVENAFNKACNFFTTEHFIEQIKQECI